MPRSTTTGTASHCSALGSTDAGSAPPTGSKHSSGASTARADVSARPAPILTQITEIIMVGGERLRVDGDAKAVEASILAAARGSLMELAWATDAQTGERIGINPDHVLLLRALTS